jgi:hypothetical protein
LTSANFAPLAPGDVIVKPAAALLFAACADNAALKNRKANVKRINLIVGFDWFGFFIDLPVQKDFYSSLV